MIVKSYNLLVDDIHCQFCIFGFKKKVLVPSKIKYQVKTNFFLSFIQECVERFKKNYIN